MSVLHWETDFQNVYQAYIALTLHTIGCIMALGMLINYIRIFVYHKPSVFCRRRLPKLTNITSSAKRFDKRNSNLNHKTHLFIAIMVTSIQAFSSYYFVTLSTLVLNIQLEQRCFWRHLPTIFVFIQRFVIYSFFLKRLRFVFENTVFELSKLKYYGFLTVMCLLFLIGLTIFIFSMVIELDSELKCSGNEIFEHFGNITVSVGGICDIIWSIIVSFAFISRLRKLLGHSPSNYKSMNSFKELMKKLTILTIVSAMTSVLLIIVCGSLRIFPYQMYTFDLIINTFCVQLSFRKMEYKYSIACKICIYLQDICCYAKNISISVPSVSPASNLDGNTHFVFDKPTIKDDAKITKHPVNQCKDLVILEEIINDSTDNIEIQVTNQKDTTLHNNQNTGNITVVAELPRVSSTKL